VKKRRVLLLLATLAACGGPDKPAARGAIPDTALPLAIESHLRQAPPHSCPTGSIYSYVERVCVCPAGEIDTTHMKRNKFGVWQKVTMVCGHKPFTKADSTYLQAMIQLLHGSASKTNR